MACPLAKFSIIHETNGERQLKKKKRKKKTTALPTDSRNISGWLGFEITGNTQLSTSNSRMIQPNASTLELHT